MVVKSIYIMLTIITAVGYNSGYGQPSYGTQQPAAYGQQQHTYQQQGYGYDAYSTAGRQGIGKIIGVH